MDVRFLTFLASQPSAAVENRERFLGMPKRGLAFLLANVMFWQPTWAQADGIVVSAPGTTVGQAGNGVPVINIATPNASGLSHNTFHDYNVGTNGLILNNATARTQSTQLGGIIIGNPNLKGGAAQTILNEVNGGSPSQLRGYTEVAGQSAHVIVANPYGITCNGCGFINTPRVTLTTGKPVLDGARLDHFQVDQGSVTVDGPMLNTTNLDRFEIITRSAKINAEIQAKDLTLVAGRNDVDAQTLKATARADDGSTKPQLAIDSSALGGMYAGAIKLVGTEAGVGVKLDGKLIASGGDIQLDANGHLRMADTSASAAVKVNAASLEVQGRVYGTALNVNTQGALTNHNTLAARDSITLSSGGQLTNNGVIEAGVNADTSRNASGDVSLNAQSLTNRNSVIASRHLTVNTGQTLDNQGGTLSAQQNLYLAAATLDNQNKGQVLSAGNLAVNAKQLLNHQGQLISNGALNATLDHLNNNGGKFNSLTTATLRVASLDNVAGLINAGELLDISASGLLNNQSGRLAAQKIRLAAANLDNQQQGSINSQGALDVTLAGHLNNQNGRLAAQQIRLDAASLDNQNKGRVLSTGNLTVNAKQLLNSQGQITSNGVLNATLDHLNNNSGELNSLTTATLRVASLDNVAGLINAGELLDISASGLLNNQSGRLAAQKIRLAAANLDNQQQGSINSQGALDVTLAGHLNNQQKGSVQAKGAVHINAGSLDNSNATLGSDTDLTLQVAGTLTNIAGNISSAGTTRLTGATLDNRDGEVTGDNALNINLSGALDNRNALLGSGQQVDITAASLDNRDGGNLVSDKRLTTHISSLLDNRNKGEVIAKGIIDLHAGSVDNRGGQLTGKDLLTLTSDSLDNRGGEIRADKDLHLSVGHLNNADKGLVSGKSGVDFTGKRLDNQKGLFTGVGLVTLNVGEVNNGQGRISSLSDLNAEITALKQQGGSLFANGNLTLTGANLDNGKGGLVGTTKALKLVVGDIDNRGGEISASRGLNVKGQRLDNSDGGKVLGTTDLELKVAQVINQSKGLIHAKGIASLKGSRLDNLGGKFDSLGALDITLDDALDNGNGLISSEGLLTVTTGRLDNRAGRLSSAGALSLTSGGVVLNQGGSISTNDALTLNSASLDNRQKGVISGKTANQVTTGHFDNSQDGRLTSTGTLNLTAGQVDNAAGRIASDLALTASVTGLDQQGGELFSKAALSLDLNHGQLNTQSGLINASGNLLLKNLNGVNNQKGEISSQQAFTLTAQQLDNSGGTLLSDQALTLRINQKLDNLKGVISAAALHSRSQTLDNTDGLISSHGRLELVVDNALTNQRGSLIADGALLLNADTLDNGSGDISSQADITATLKHLVNQHGKLISTGAFNLSAASVDNRLGGLLGATQALTLNVEALDNRGGELTTHADLSVIGNTLDNRAGHLSSLKNTRVQLSGELDNTQGRFSSEGTLKVDAGQLLNAKGSLSSAGDLTFNSVGRVDNQGGELVTNGTLKLDSASLDNRQQGSLSGKGPVIVTTGAFDNSQKGQLNSSNTLTLNAAQVTNQDGGRIGSDGALTAKVSGLDQQGGKLFSKSTLSLDLNHGQLNNQNGLINAPGSLLLTNINGVNNDGGEISSAEAFTLVARSLDNSNGKLLNNQGLTLRIAELLINTKGLIGAAKLDIHAANLNNDGGTLTSRSDLDVGVVQALNNLNQGQISAAQDLTLNTLLLNNRNSRVLAGNRLTLNAFQVDNTTQGLINSLGELNITGNGLDSSDGGEVSAKGDIRLDLKSLVQNGGRVLGEKAVTLDLAYSDFDNRNGLLNAKGPLTLKRLHDLHNQGGEISSHQSFTVAGQTLDNTGGSLISNEQLTLNGNTLINRGGLMSGLKGLAVTGASLDNSYSGSLSSRNGHLGVNLSGNLLNNYGGGLAAQGNLSVSGKFLDNGNKGVLSSGGGQTLDLSTGLNNSQEGLISSGAGLVINTNTLANTNATINAQQAITINAGDLDNSLGKLLGNGAMTLALHGVLDNSEGKIASAGPLLISGATEIKNRIGELASKNALTLLTLDLDNRSGTLAANDTLTLSASGTVQNSAKGLIHSQNAGVSVEAASLVNGGGAIQSQNGLTLDISGDFDNQLGKVIAQNGDVSVKAANIDNRGGVLSSLKGALEARTVGVLRNGYETNTRQGGLIQAQRLNLQALTRLDNVGGRLSAQAGDSLVNTATFDNRNGSLYAKGLTHVTAGTFDNSDGQVGGTRIELGLSGILNNRNGLIESDGTLAVSAVSVDNQGGKLRSLGTAGKTEFQIGGVFDNRNGSLETDNSDLTLAASSFLNVGGQLLHLGEGNFDISLANVTGAGGNIVTRGGLTLKADSWTNTSVIQAGRLYVNVDNFVQTAAGQLLASTLFEGRGVNWTNDGLIASDGELSINLSGAYRGNGRVNSIDKLIFSAASLNLPKNGSIVSGGPSEITISSPFINYGGITSDDDLQINSPSLNNFGTLGSGQKLILNTPELLNQKGLIFSGADMQLRTNRLTNRYGDIYSFGGLTVAQNAAGARADVVENISGTIESAGDMRLLAATMSNRKEVLTYNTEPVDSFIDHQCTHCEGKWNVWYYIHEIQEQMLDKDSPSAFLTAGGNLDITGASLHNQYSSVSAAKNINITVDSFSNEGINLLRVEYINHYRNPKDREPGRIYQKLVAPGGAVYEYNKYNSKYIVPYRQANGKAFEDEPFGRTSELNPDYNPAQIITAPKAVINYGRFAQVPVPATTAKNVPAVIQAGGKVNIVAATAFNNSVKTENAPVVSRNRQIDATGITHATTPFTFILNSQLPPDLAHQRVDPLTLPGFVMPQGQNGLFRLSEKAAHTGTATSVNTGPQNWTLGGATLSPIQRQQDLPATLARPIEIDNAATVTASDRHLAQAARTGASIDATPSVITLVAPADPQSTGPVLPTHTLTADIPGQPTVVVAPPIVVAPVDPQLVSPVLPTHTPAVDTSGQPTVGVTPLVSIDPPRAQSIARVTGLPDTQVQVKSHNYLIETNPVITDLKQFMGSDYLLSNLGYDPDKAVKRLGDGFFEQRLVQQAVVARTGQRFLDGMNNNEDMLRHLMDNAIASKKELNLSVGVNLTSQQVAALTHDIVWLEEAVVSGEKVLVPVFYMAQANNRLGPTGALILGQDVSIIAGKDLNNSGTLRATKNLTVSAMNDVVNTGLMEAGGRLNVLAGNDIVNRNGGIINAADVNLSAVMGDVVNQRNVTRIDGKNGKWTWTGSYADNAARIESANSLNIQAGRDFNSLGGVMSSRADLTINAGRDVNIGAAETLSSMTDGRDHRSSSIEQLSSQLTAGRDLRIDTARNLLVAASDLSAGLGMDLSAGANVLITAAANENHFYKKGHVATRQTDHVEQQASVLRAGNGLNIAAGENLTLVASKLEAGQDAYLVAGSNLDLQAAENSDYSFYSKVKKSSSGKKKRLDEVASTTNIGSTVTSGKDSVLVASQDLTIQGSGVIADKGAARLVAGNDVHIGAVTDTNSARHESSSSKSSWGGLKSKKVKDQLNEIRTQAVGSMISGDTVSVTAARDVDVEGSSLVSTGDLKVQAVRDLTVDAAENTFRRKELHKVKTRDLSGVMTANNLGIDDITGNQHLSIGAQKRNGKAQETTLTGSTIGSSEGEVKLIAGRELQVIASDLISTKDMTLSGSDVTIAAGIETARQSSTDKSNGLAVGRVIGGMVIDTAKSIRDNIRAAQNADDGRLKAVKTAQALLAGYNLTMAPSGSANDADGKPANSAGSLIKIGTELGSTRSKSTSEYSSETAKPSSLSSGAGLAIIATGKAQGSVGDLHVIGSTLKAQDTLLVAQNNISLESAQNRKEWDNQDNHHKTSIGASFNLGAQNGFTLDLGAQIAKSMGTGSELIQVNSTVDTDRLVIKSAQDTTLAGALVRADRIDADIGGNLNISSRQDEASQINRQKSGGFGGSICIPPICVGAPVTASASIAASKMDSAYKAVIEQTGLFAGDGGYNINVGATTVLKGAVIASEASADKNQLSTDRLIVSDVRNSSEVESKAAGVSVSYTGGWGGGGDVGLGGSVPLMLTDSDHSRTRAAISEGTITVRNPEGANDLVGLNRNTANANQKLDRPDEKAMQERMDLIQGVVDLAKGTLDAVVTAKKHDAEKQGKAAKTPEQKAAANAAMTEANRWATGGDKRIMADIATGLLAAGFGGTGGATGVGIVANTTAADTYAKIGDYAKARSAEAKDDATRTAWAEGGTARVLLHTLAGAVQGLAGGNVQAGAMGAATSATLMPAIAKVLGNNGIDTEGQNIWAALIATGLSGAASSGGGLLSAIAGGKAGAGVDLYNRQLHPDEVKFLQDKERIARYIRQIKEQVGEDLSPEQAARLLSQGGAALTDAHWTEINGTDLITQSFIREEAAKSGLAYRDVDGRMHLYFVATPDEYRDETINLKALFDAYGGKGSSVEKYLSNNIVHEGQNQWRERYQEGQVLGLADASKNYDGAGGVLRGVADDIEAMIIGLTQVPSAVKQSIGSDEVGPLDSVRMADYYQKLLHIQSRALEAGYIAESEYATNQRLMLLSLPLSELGGLALSQVLQVVRASGALRVAIAAERNALEAQRVAPPTKLVDGENAKASAAGRASLPLGYREGRAANSAFNEVGGLPEGHRRVINTKSGNIEVLAPDGRLYFETDTGLKPKEGGNLAGLVAAEKEIAGAKGAGEVASIGGKTCVYNCVVDGVTRYVGITDDIVKRGQAHLRQKGIVVSKIRGLDNISRADARAVEQTLIDYHGLGKDGGTLINKINSISSVKNPTKYEQGLIRGAELLKKAGYEGF